MTQNYKVTGCYKLYFDLSKCIMAKKGERKYVVSLLNNQENIDRFLKSKLLKYCGNV